jgi:pSer/pThr/pTyr-binding forkhead associated (FHA) protein
MVCPFCKISIDDDSFYCDRCGKEILVCPKCNKHGKGKMCTSDGTPLVAVKSRTGSQVISASDSISQLKSIIQPIPAPVGAAGGLRLVNKNLNIDLKIQGDTVIGRESGDFMDIFSKHSQVSKQHCQISFDSQKGWIITDLNSTNGTKYNNIPLKPLQPQPLLDKSFILIANIEFYIEVQSQGDKTVRV